MPGKRLEWDAIGERLYEIGVDHVVLYMYDNGKYKKGVVWNGVTGITENKSGAEPSPLYADNIKYLVLKSIEEYGLTLEGYTYPDEFEACNGMAELHKGVVIGQQTRKSFGLSFRTLVGNDTEGEAHGYKLHLVYGCDASPSEETNNTTNDSPDPKTFSYEISTTPVAVTDHQNTSCVTIDSTEIEPGDSSKLEKLEKILYGEFTEGDLDGYTEEDGAILPFPDEVKSIFDAV